MFFAFIVSLHIGDKSVVGLLIKKKAKRLSWYLALVVLCIHASHECQEFGRFVFCYGWLVWYVIILENPREHVGNGLAFRVAHGIDSSVCTFSDELVLQAVAVAVAADNAAHFPEAEVVEEFTTGDAYLAHEQLKDVVGGIQFFETSSLVPAGEPSDACFSSGSPLGMR